MPWLKLEHDVAAAVVAAAVDDVAAVAAVVAAAVVAAAIVADGGGAEIVESSPKIRIMFINTVGLRIPIVFGFGMVKSNSDDKWCGFRTPFKT